MATEGAALSNKHLQLKVITVEHLQRKRRCMLHWGAHNSTHYVVSLCLVHHHYIGVTEPGLQLLPIMTVYLKAVWAHGYWDIRQNVIEVLISNGLPKLLYKHLIPVQGSKDMPVHHHRGVRGTAHLQRNGVREKWSCVQTRLSWYNVILYSIRLDPCHTVASGILETLHASPQSLTAAQ